MQKRKLGASGPEVSLVGLGTNNFGGRIDLEASRRVVDEALDLGITLIDTADTYGNSGGSEEVSGRRSSGSRRKNVVLATKFGLPMDDAGKLRGASRRYIMQAVEASLRRLQDRLDRSLSVAPARSATPIEETLRALDDLVKSRKGPLHRLLQSLGRAARRSDDGFAAARPRVIRLLPGRIQPARTRSLEKDRVPVMRKHGLACCRIFRSPADC